MNTIHEYQVLIRESHLDTFGHVNNATYLALFEEARWEIISPAGYDLNFIKKSGFGPVILEIKIKYLKELTLRSHIKIKTQFIEYKSKILFMKQWMENERNEVCCEAEFVAALFDTHNRKLVNPTPEWLKALGV